MEKITKKEVSQKVCDGQDMQNTQDMVANAYRILVKNVKGTDNVQDLGENWNMILKLILK